MISKYCKCKNTYTRDCDCENSVWSQGIGSLIGQGSSAITRSKGVREMQETSSENPTSGQGTSNVTQVENERTI